MRFVQSLIYFGSKVTLITLPFNPDSTKAYSFKQIKVPDFQYTPIIDFEICLPLQLIWHEICLGKFSKYITLVQIYS